MLIFEDAYIGRVLLFAIYKIVVSASLITYARH